MLSKIDWTGRTWELTDGCTRKDEECTNCYAENLVATRLKHRHPGIATFSAETGAHWTGEFQIRLDKLREWETWKHKRGPELVFVNSRSDLFHEKCPPDFILQVWEQFALAGQRGHTFQVVTKRPEVAAEVLPWVYREMRRGVDSPLPNVWLLTSVGRAESMRTRGRALAECPAAVRGFSMEPLLEDVSGELAYLLTYWPRKFHWGISGGESARPYNKARPSHPEWHYKILKTLWRAGIPYFFKQWGCWVPISKPLPPYSPAIGLELAQDEAFLNIAGGSVAEGGDVWRMRNGPIKNDPKTLFGMQYHQFPTAKVAGYDEDWNTLYPKRYGQRLPVMEHA
jgi:protein gp37